MRTELNGVLLLDKPVGLSSHEALKRAQHLMSAAKAGHTGTLDPLASGLLPLCFGEATKFAQDLLDATKTYEATLALGATTATGDAQGRILSARPVRCTLDEVLAALARFRGKLLQVPPMYSALKRNGKPLYAYARRDITLERPARPVTIKTLELLNAELHPSPSAFFSEIAQGESAKTVWGSMRAEQVSMAQRWRRPRSDPEYTERRSDAVQAAEKCSSVFERFGVPVLQALISSMTREQWQRSARGLNPLDTAMNVALPEFDGRMISVPVAFKTQPESSKETGTHYEALPERAERVAGLAMRVACLRKTPNAQKRIAFILTNASGKAAQIGNAVGLDAPASLMKILHAMQAHGYRIEGLPDASDQLMQQLINQGSYDEDFLTAEQMRAAVARVPADQYAQWFDALPAEPRQKMLDQWGAPPGTAYVDDNGDLMIAGF